ncbi:MAG: flagellar basal-body rod protein FlgF [Terracidiphilus sp.]|jgi:flagellar basal-body rod protein FlgF/flagellar basal-body rod protein FlgG
MDSGYYAACTALVTRTQAMDTIANNLANANTVGYRAEHNVFRSVLADAGDREESSFDQVVNRYGILSGTAIDETQGALQKTGNELDMAIDGPGFFVVKTANGTMYTRNGAFQVSASRQLVTSNGDVVMGDRGAITLPSGNISISADGTISSNGAVSGKLSVVEFTPGTELTSMGNTYYTAPPDSETPSGKSSVRQGMLESSNVNPILGLVELISAQRQAEMAQRTLTEFSNEMDKLDSQDLSKVS